ncbi:elongator complex protein 2 [Microplitis mediator]|uniref:elongator complex protein 2 n=1 Tax=Microplitis mediator TaxID=375433 RepID=UPI002555CD92|nr:elongator complex protein 2 [Microplitis mediator]
MKVTTDYISCGSNCQPHAVDWCPNNNIICYASSNSVIIYDPDYLETGRVVQTLLKHQSQVKIVEWISNNVNKSSEILSASLDGTIIIWSQSASKTYEPTSILTLNDNLSTAHAAYCPKSSSNTNQSSSDNSLLIAGSSFQDIFKIWYRNSDSIVEQNLNLNKKIPNEIKITHLPGDSPIPAIIMCLDDATIHIYTWNIYTDMSLSELNFIHTIELRGHQDWIQCLDIVDYNRQSALMATGSQDGTIRLWKISSIAPEAVDHEQRYQFSINNNNFDISLESVLNGHDHWVYGVHWSPKTNNLESKPLQLLSSGLDKTIIIWEQSLSGVWIETVKLGKVGGNSIGFYGCKFNSDASSVLAQGYQGTFHLWKYNNNIKKWRPRPGPSGHFDQVTDLHWEPNGKCLLTTSLDQTTRIHVPWTIKLSSVSSPNWHEMARPQIHGYDINCITILNSTMFCSGADEKVIRIFKAPTSFIDAFNCNDWSKALKVTDSASVPALGLTNKTTDDKQQYLDAIDDNDNDDNIERPPTEEEIIRYTLWPELEKLYGHGYELFAISGRNDGKLIATACKSTSAEYSAIILWSTETWAQIDKLMSHRLTVTQLEFSPDGKYLLSVSRDRRWSLFYTDSGDNYKLIACSAAKSLHTRIIWCCSWSHDSKYFATGSRDGKIGLWSVDQLKKNPDSMPVSSIELPDDSVTALNFLNKFIDNSYILAVGFDDGTIEIRKITKDKANIEWICCKKLDNQQAHHKTVKRLSFRPTFKDNSIELASCSADRAVKIYTFYIADNCN